MKGSKHFISLAVAVSAFSGTALADAISSAASTAISGSQSAANATGVGFGTAVNSNAPVNSVSATNSNAPVNMVSSSAGASGGSANVTNSPTYNNSPNFNPSINTPSSASASINIGTGAGLNNPATALSTPQAEKKSTLGSINVGSATDPSNSGSAPFTSQVGNSGNSTLIFAPEGSKIPPSPPSGIYTLNQSPSLFSNPTDTGAVKGWDLVVKYVNSCQPVFSSGAPSIIDMKDGQSNLTKIAYWVHPSSFGEKTFVSKDSSTWCDPNDTDLQGCYRDQANEGRIVPINPTRVTPTFPNRIQGTCLGIISVEGMDSKQALPIHVISDAINYTLNNVKGYSEVHVVSIANLLGFALEMQNSGKGFGVSPGGSHVNSGLTNIFTALLGFGFNSGETAYNLRPGNTFLLFAPKDTGPVIDLVATPKPALAPDALPQKKAAAS